MVFPARAHHQYGGCAKALLNNDRLESYGERAAVTRSTLRSHLAHLFNKTGTCRHSELVRLLMLAQPRV